MASTLRPNPIGVAKAFCNCGTELKVSKFEFGYNHLMGGPTVAVKVEICPKCLEKAKQTPEDWLPGV